MSKIMLINVTHAEESRVGIVTDGVLSSFEIESFSREHLKGNLYKGVIQRIHPALEAAFVDIGADRNAFLPLDEICFRNLPNGDREQGDGTAGANGRRRGVRIQDILKPGDEILVQIVKEEFATKPPTLSTFYSLPGRYLVYLPGSEDAGISRRIEGDERQRIRELIEQLQPPAGVGLIVRTATGLDQGIQELQRDLTYLQRLWESIQQAATHKRGPTLVYREHDLVLRNIRDYFTPDVDEIHVDNEEVYERARAFLREVMPGKEQVLRLYSGHQPIFSQFNVENQIESIYKRRVPLKSGGSIVLDGTEALTAIDVNSGRSTRGTNQEETAFRTNREAAAEIARQLRLRDVGGLIVIDFIDMKNPTHIGEVERTLRNAMREDKARHEVGRISQFGLLEVSRQRLRPAAAASSYIACPMCEGYGLVRTTESAALVGLRKIHNRLAKGDVATLRASFPTEVAIYLLNQKREDIAQLEKRYGTKIQIVLSQSLLPHQAEFEVRPRVEGDSAESKPLRLGGVTSGEQRREREREREASQPPPPPPPTPEPRPADVRPTPSPAPAVSAAAPAGRPAAEPQGEGQGDAAGRRPRRRRGRRRGRGRQAVVAVAEGLTALGVAAGFATATPGSDGNGEFDFADDEDLSDGYEGDDAELTEGDAFDAEPSESPLGTRSEQDRQAESAPVVDQSVEAAGGRAVAIPEAAAEELPAPIGPESEAEEAAEPSDAAAEAGDETPIIEGEAIVVEAAATGRKPRPRGTRGGRGRGAAATAKKVPRKAPAKKAAAAATPSPGRGRARRTTKRGASGEGSTGESQP